MAMKEKTVISAAVPRAMALLVDTLADGEGLSRSAWIRRALRREATERVSGATNGKEVAREHAARR